MPAAGSESSQQQAIREIDKEEIVAAAAVALPGSPGKESENDVDLGNDNQASSQTACTVPGPLFNHRVMFWAKCQGVVTGDTPSDSNLLVRDDAGVVQVVPRYHLCGNTGSAGGSPHLSDSVSAVEGQTSGNSSWSAVATPPPTPSAKSPPSTTGGSPPASTVKAAGVAAPSVGPVKGAIADVVSSKPCSYWGPIAVPSEMPTRMASKTRPSNDGDEQEIRSKVSRVFEPMPLIIPGSIPVELKDLAPPPLVEPVVWLKERRPSPREVKSGKFFPVLTWEEPIEGSNGTPFGPMVSTGSSGVVPTAEDHTSGAVLKESSCWLHSSTRLPNHEGLIPDTGAVDDISGSEFVDRQALEASKHGYEVEWEKLERPKGVSGVGGKDKVCHQRARIPCALPDKSMMKYCPAVIPTSDVPPLVGVDSMSRLNVFFGTRDGAFTMVPEGQNENIVWPEGTKHIKCVQAPSKHWLLTVSAWNEISREKESTGKPASSFVSSSIYPGDKALVPAPGSLEARTVPAHTRDPPCPMRSRETGSPGPYGTPPN